MTFVTEADTTLQNHQRMKSERASPRTPEFTESFRLHSEADMAKAPDAGAPPRRAIAPLRRAGGWRFSTTLCALLMGALGFAGSRGVAETVTLIPTNAV